MSQATSQSTSLSLIGKTALVIGRATGIGKASALAAAGARVVVNTRTPGAGRRGGGRQAVPPDH